MFRMKNIHISHSFPEEVIRSNYQLLRGICVKNIFLRRKKSFRGRSEWPRPAFAGHAFFFSFLPPQAGEKEVMVKNKTIRSAAPLAVAFLTLFVFFAFRAVFGASVNAAPASSAPPDFLLYEPVTVESFAEQYDVQNLVVLKPDGTQRTSGEVESGDIIEIVDENGAVLENFTAVMVKKTSSGPSAPDSSQAPESSGPPAPVSSQAPESSEPSAPVSSQTQESENFPKGTGGYYLFSGPVTMEDLADEISTQPDGLWLRVTAPSGKEKTSGGVCTGDTVETLDGDGRLESRIIAVIPGDLTGDGTVTDTSLNLLRDCLLNKDTLNEIESRAADMSGDGSVDTSDLLLMEKSREAE